MFHFCVFTGFENISMIELRQRSLAGRNAKHKPKILNNLTALVPVGVEQ